MVPVIVLGLKEDLAKLARERQAHGQTAPGKTLPPNLAEASERGETRDALADMAGISHGTLDKVERIEREVIPGPALRCPVPTLFYYQKRKPNTSPLSKERSPAVGGKTVGGG